MFVAKHYFSIETSLTIKKYFSLNFLVLAQLKKGLFVELKQMYTVETFESVEETYCAICCHI